MRDLRVTILPIVTKPKTLARPTEDGMEQNQKRLTLPGDSIFGHSTLPPADLTGSLDWPHAGLGHGRRHHVGASIFVRPSEVSRAVPDFTGMLLVWIAAGALTWWSQRVRGALVGVSPNRRRLCLPARAVFASLPDFSGADFRCGPCGVVEGG